MKSAFFHIINPNSKTRKSVARYLKRHGNLVHHWVKRESHPTHLETLVEWAYEEGYRHLAIWGGDGSFSRVIQYLKERNWLADVKLALIPAGTCNDFARYLQLGSWRQMIEQLPAMSRKTIAYDVAVVKAGRAERIFINNAGFGRSMERAAAGKSNPVKDIFELTKKSMSIEWDSKSHHEFQTISGLMMIVFNAPYFSGGLHFTRDANAVDRELNAVMVPDRSRWQLLARFAMGRLGRPLLDDAMTYFEAESIHVILNEPVYIQTDGELAFGSAQKDVSFSLLAKKIQIVSPNAVISKK